MKQPKRMRTSTEERTEWSVQARVADARKNIQEETWIERVRDLVDDVEYLLALKPSRFRLICDAAAEAHDAAEASQEDLGEALEIINDLQCSMVTDGDPPVEYNLVERRPELMVNLHVRYSVYSRLLAFKGE